MTASRRCLLGVVLLLAACKKPPPPPTAIGSLVEDVGGWLARAVARAPG